jgi:alkylation response protein AidB-like acyl-CoA dehydrogenase
LPPSRPASSPTIISQRFFADAEALYSYEGTYQMQNLIVGKAITGHGAFV